MKCDLAHNSRPIAPSKSRCGRVRMNPIRIWQLLFTQSLLKNGIFRQTAQRFQYNPEESGVCHRSHGLLTWSNNESRLFMVWPAKRIHCIDV